MMIRDATLTLRAIMAGGDSRRRHGRLTDEQRRVRDETRETLRAHRAAVRGDAPPTDAEAYCEAARRLQGEWARATGGKVGYASPLNR